mgnify:CR=1
MSIISESKLWKKRLGDWVINPYVGCEHGCKHCYCPASSSPTADAASGLGKIYFSQRRPSGEAQERPIVLEAGHTVRIQTRSALVERDFDRNGCRRKNLK